MKTPTNKTFTTGIRLFAAAMLIAVSGLNAADPEPSIFVTLTNDVGTTIDNSPVPVGQAAIGNGWDYSAAAPVSGTIWNKIAKPATTPTAGGPYTETAPFVINTLNDFQMYDSEGSITSVRLKGVVLGTITSGRSDPRLYNVGGATAKELLNDTWGMYTGDTEAYMLFTFTGLAANTDYILYLYSNVADANQGGKWILHPDNFPAVTTSTFYYPTLPERQTNYVDLSGHTGVVTLFTTGTDGKNRLTPDATINTAAASGDNTLWGTLHAKSTSAGKISFRTATSALGGRRWYTGFQLTPYPEPTIIEQPESEVVGVLDEITEITAIVRDMPYINDIDQNPLTCAWQLSKDDGATWTDIPNPDPSGAYVVSTITESGDVGCVLQIASTKDSDAGIYRLSVTNVAGKTIYSNNAALSVIDEPAPFNFTQQPSPLVAVAGNNVRLSAAVTGTPPFQFVWQKSDTADFTTFQNVQTSVRGPATDNALDFPSIQKSATGHYRVMVTDVRRRASSAIHSDVVYVYVEYAAPVITPPGPQTVVPGNTISLYGGATTDPGAPIHAYQWQVSHDGGVTWTNITDDGTYFGANTSVLTIANAGEAQAGLYRLAADNSITTPHGPEGGITNGDAISLRVGPALVPHPSSVAADRAGNLYVTDDTTNTLYRFTLASGTAVLFAGQSGVAGSADGFYDQATFNGPGGAVAGAANTVFLADTLNHTIRYAQSNGDVRTIAGSPSSSDNVDATGAAAAFTAPVSVSYDAAGNLYVADKVAHTIRRITPVNYDVTTLAGSAGNPGADDGATTDNSLNTIARFTSPGAVAVSPVNLGFSGTTKTITIETPTTNATTLYVADTGNNTIRKIALGWYLDRDPITNVQTRTRISKSDVTTIAGLYGVSGADNGSGADARFNQPSGIAVDRLGAIYVADTGNHVIRKISFVASNTVSVLTIAGTPGVAGYQDGPSDEPHGGINLFNRPTSVSVDDDLNVYVADTGNAAVRMISGVDGSVSTLVFAQGPTPEPSGTSGSGTNGNTDPIDMPPAGHGDGGGAPSLWYLLGLALLGLGRVRTGSLRKHFMKFTSIFCIIGVAAALAFAPSAQAEDAPAVFLKLTRQNESAGAAPTAATTEAIAAPGSGWGYSAAAPYPGTTWNFIKRPADADSRDFTTAIGVYTLNTVNNLALTAPDGTASGVSVTAKLDVTEAQGQRAEPGYGSVTADTVLGPVALMNNNGNWRIYYGSNNTIWEFTGLPADAHYLAYCYAATHTAGQGARFILPADYNPVTTGSVWLETHGGDGTNANVFARVDDIISPRDPAPLAVSSNTAPNINTVWGFFHAKVDAAGKLVLQTAKNAQNGQYPTGFQLIPYPKATITTDLPATTVATLNNSVSFTIVATGFDTDDVLTYQWRKDGVDIPGATGATHTITSAQTSDEGDYDVVVTNYGGDTASTATALTVTTSAIAPSITVQPLPQTALTNGSVSFTVAANGTSPLTYIWQKSVTGAAGAFVDIAGAPNAATLTLADITTADAGHYRVTITNGTAPDAVSTAVPLVVAPVVTTQPVGQITTVGAVTSLSAVFDVGAGAPEATTYAWTFNDAALADGNGVTGAATDTLQFAAFAATNSGYYALTATNSAGSKTTSTVYIGTASSQAVTFAPADQSTGISIDQQLRIVFPSAPKIGRGGKLTLHDASDNSVVATIDVSQFETYTAWDVVIPTGARRTVQGKEYFYQPIAIFGNEAWITLGPGQRLAYGKTYYVNIESAVLLDSDGASLPAITDATTWRFSTKTAGPATPTATTGPTTITVGHDGAGDFATLQAASDWIPQNNTLPRTIVIKPGTYRDNTTFSQNRNFVTVHGDGAQRADVVLYYEYPYYTTDRGAAVLNIECNDINVINLTIDNRVYFPHPATNAPAWIGTVNTVYTSGSRVVFDNVLMKGGQDTLYTDKGIATFHNSEIWGSVDFIYGGALAIFDQCDIVQIRSTGGPIGAPSTPLAQPHGIVFLNCNFPKALMSNGYPYDVGAANTTFMRPWRQDGHTASINGMLSDIFTAKGWGEWDGREATCRAVELGSTLAGGGSVTTEQRHTSGAYWVNTIDPDYTGATDEYVGNPNLLLPDGPANRTAITVTAADYTLEAILGNSYYSLAGWLPTAKPKILAQPVAQSVDETDPVTLSVSAWSPRFQTYQWYKDSAPISGATGDTYALTSATELDSGSYYVVVTSNQGSTTSDTVTVTVNSNTPTGIPVIATQPESQTFVMGDTVTFSVAATGGGLSYQWYKDGIAIPGETGASLTLNGVNLSDAGEYHVVISNTFGDTPSSTITLTYDTTAPKPAVFVKLHRDQDSAGAAPVAAEKLTVAVQGSGWDYTAAAPYAGTTWNKIRRPHGTDLISSGTAGGTYPGVIGTVATLNTADNIKLFSPDGTDSGVKFTAQVHINALDGVRQEPNAGYIGGYTETLMPAAVVNDLWRLIIGDNTFTFTFSDLPPSSRYLVYVYGALNNGNARFDLAPDNVADTNAKWVGIYATNNNASTHVFAKDLEDNIAPVAPAPPEDTTTDIDKPWGVLPALTDAAGQLVISATKFNGSTYVAGFQLIPYPVATITTQPAATELVDLDDNITLTVVAAGFDSSDTLSYQWRKDGADIDTLANATAATASLTITGAQSADAGSYDVVITNLGGAVTSTACALAVNDGSATEIPAITAQPVSLVTDAGDAVTLSVDATGGGLSYQWYKDGVLIPGATGATLDIANPQASDTGSYHVVITNSFGDTTSTTVTLTVESTAAAPAVFIKLHRDQASSAGVQSAAEMLTVAVQGSGWDYSGAAPYAGTTWNKIRRPNSADMINSGTAGGTYPGVIGAVETLNTANNISLYAPDGTASAVTLTTKITINALNADRQEPNAGYIGGYTETLMPAAVVNDLWRLIVGDNTFTFTFNNLPAGGRYLAYVYGALNNGNARFDLAPANVASTNARWVGIYATNSNASTHVFAKDIENNVAPVAPAPPEDSTTTIDKPWGVLPAIIDAGGQLVISATKFNGSTYVAGFQLIPYPKATIITQPATTEVAVAGNTATLTVVAAGFDSNDTVTYQWRKDGAPINTADNATANTASLVITDAQDADAGSYDVVVTNYGGSTTSTACALSISGSSAESAPAITAQPVSQITDAGDSVTLSVDATGGALAYQWYKDGVAIPGANGATLTIDNPQSSDAGSYHVVITNNLGEATSDSVTLTVEGATAAPALFVKLTRQSAAASAAPTAAATFTLAAPGSGWNYSAAAPYPGTTWNTIQRPADADSTNLSTVIGTYVLNTGSNIALTAADGTASGVSLTASLDVTSASNARAEPGYSSPTVDSVLGPEALMNGNGIWRIYYGSNNTIWEFAGLPAGTHYLAYGYGSTNSAGQGARFLLATSNTTAGAATWFETAGAASASVFVDTDSVISPRAPVMPEVLSSAASNTETTWGVLHGKVDAAGKFTVQTTKNANNGQYIAGFQLIPYPKTVIDVDAPSTLSVPAGGTATIPVTALGFDANDSVTYQWRKDGVAINTADNATANTATLVIADAQLADEADYDLVITNYGGSIISGVCELTVLPGVGAPTIYTQPVSQTAVTNATANFSAAVGGLAPLTYVWQKSSTGVDADFVDIPGATNSALVLAGVTTADAGYYRIKITNDEGSATSDTVTLIIAPVITTQPETAVVTIGSPASVSVVADTGIAAAPFAPTYQWRLDGVDIPGATSATYSIASFNSATDEGSYTVVVTNAAGSVTSDAAVLCDPVLPVFTTQPAAAQTVVTGMNVTFVSSATGIPAPAYQWNYNGAPITSATNATYTITGAALADTGTYTVVATNMAGSTPSDPSILTVRDAAGPAAVSDGFGSEATGGAGGAVYVVTNATDLLAKAALDEPAIITVSGTISLLGVSNKRAPVKSNKTIQGADANATIIGEIQISYVDNVIVRGLTITNPGETIDTDPGSPTYGKYIDSGDGINVWGSTNVFITHCTLFNCGDGCIDITRAEVDNVTVSWCKFYYTDALAHRFTMILGNIETDNPDYIGPVHTTLHHNWWAEFCHERMPASTGGRVHMYDNYFSCAGNFYASNARNNTQLFVEHSYYGTGVNSPVGKSAGTSALIRTIDNIYNGTTGTIDPGTDTVFTPPYSYHLNAAGDLPVLIPQYGGNTDGAFSITPAVAAPLSVVASSTIPFHGDTVTLVPSLGGAGTAYQWRLNNFDIPGATSETLTLANIQSAQLGAYTVVVTTAADKHTVSAPVTITFGDAPSFSGLNGGAITAISGKAVTLNPSVNGAGLVYQWQRFVDGGWIDLADNATYSGANTGSLTIGNIGDAQAGDYRLVVSNPSGSATGNPYTVSVAPVLFPYPTGVAVDSYGDLYIADSALNVVRKVAASGSTAVLYAGIPNTAGYKDGAFGVSMFNAPAALAIDASGNLYVADTGNAVVRRVNRDGSLETLAGDPSGRGNRDGIGTAVLFSSPNGLSFDRTTGVTYLADTNNHTIRRLTPINPSSGVYVGNTVATIGGIPGSSGDNDAWLVDSGTAMILSGTGRYNHPAAVAFSGSFLYIADAGNNTIRKLTVASGTNFGVVQTIAGTPGVNGSDDGPGLTALFDQPKSIVVDASGANIYVADTGNHTIRKVTPAGDVITLAGLATVSGQSDGEGMNALFNQPTALALDSSGRTLYVADTGNAAVRKIAISGTSATVTTLAVTLVSDTMPPSGTTPPFNPSSDGKGDGGGGAPSHWFFGALVALALLRLVRRGRKA